MPTKQASAALAFGMAQIPFGIAKASAVDVPELTSLCDCGSTLSYIEDDEGNRISCDSSECDTRISWWNQVPAKGYELGDDIIQLGGDEIDAARENVPVETGKVEKAADVADVLLHYAVEGNYYLLPEDGFKDQYGALVAALNDLDVALLTYLAPFGKVQRYAIVSRGGVLIALLLRDKKALPDLDYGTDEGIESQAVSMVEAAVEGDPTLPEVEGHGLKELVKEKATADEPDAEPVMPEV